MKKVKLTKEQEIAINMREKTDGNFDAFMRHHIKNGWGGETDKCLTSLTPSEIVKAWNGDYVVGVEVGDWVITDGYSDDYDGIALKISKISQNEFCYFENSSNGRDNFSLNHIIRHATPEEIAKETERSWWKKHGRDYWELKEDDILYYDGHIFAVYEETEIYVKLYSGGEYSLMAWSVIKNKYAVACFAEDRKDVDHE